MSIPSPRRGLILSLVTAGTLLAILAAVHQRIDGLTPSRAVFAGAVPVRDLGEPDDDEDLEAMGLVYTPTFTIARPTRLSVEARRGEEPGWLGVQVALVNEDTAEVRERSVEPARGASARVVFGAVPEGRYTVRLLAGWDARGTRGAPRGPGSVEVRVFEGGRPRMELGLLVALLLGPALFSLLRRRRG